MKDRDIRVALEAYLRARVPNPSLLIHELRVHNGRAIADVVAVYSQMHCFEIKGETDTIGRILAQAAFYNESFPRVTLVTTPNHLAWSLRNAPDFWGIATANKRHDQIVTIAIRRRAKRNPEFSKPSALLMLWRDELMELARCLGMNTVRAGDSRQELAEKIGKFAGRDAISGYLARTVARRYLRLNRAHDIGDVRR